MKDDFRSAWEAQLHSPDITERQRRKILKLLETHQRIGTSPDAARQFMRATLLRSVLFILAAILAVAGLGFGLAYGISWIIGVTIEQTAPIQGDPERFDPVASYPMVRDFAGEGSRLVSLRALYVKRDGTMDLMAPYGAETAYVFIHPVPAPKDAPPIGAGSSLEDAWHERVTIRVYEPGQWRRVQSFGRVNADYSYQNRGMERDASEPVSTPVEPDIPSPACGMATLWDAALEAGAPEDAVATVDYDARGYVFTISGADIRLRFDAECRRTE
ncbi:hypothetical protein L0Y59_03530 [Candidatus Uhrbacteria bacterium]|nr:hypothetical protein [Candidatus Uhrbacteria bacterium]